MPESESIERTLRVVVDLLVKKDYAELERLTNGVHLHASDIERGVRDYGMTIAHPPPEAYSSVDVIRIDRSVHPAWSVRFRLFTLEEGVSDLELQATLIDRSPGEALSVELDNIIVA